MSREIHLFERFGVELEYMIVDRRTLAVRPLADRVLHAIAGAYESEVEVGLLSWSNELVTHVIELKTNGPAESLDGLAELFQEHVGRIGALLAGHGCMLMPTAMHPWMDPHTETVLWPHEYSPIYEAFNRVFDCRGHGWSNLQCTHVNLPFAGDEEFGRLHAAIRLVLPILPALAASSPIIDGRPTGLMDTRLEVYRLNARRVPQVSGRVIPEPAYSRAAYDEQILRPLYREIAPHDPEGILQYEWLNARGAIARFDRNTIEIRVLDIQECPLADLAVLMLVVRVLRALAEQRWCGYEQQREWSVDGLEPILLDCIREADGAMIGNAAYLRAFGFAGAERCTAGALWRHLFEALFTPQERASDALAPLRVILGDGCLSRRILRRLGEAPGRDRIADVYRSLCESLEEGRMFGAAV